MYNLRDASAEHVFFSTRRGPSGAWQRFERGEIPLFTFYEGFGRDLSDTQLGNTWYSEYCKQRGIGVYGRSNL